VRYWDRAATADGGCYTAGILMALDPDGNYYVEHVVHGQWEPDERDQHILATARRDRTRYQSYQPTIYIEQEPGASGIDSYKYLARTLAGFSVSPHRPTGAKEVRAEPWASQCAAKNVYLVEDGTWDVPGFIDEHLQFPMGKLKDRVDAASGAFGKLVNCGPTGTVRILGAHKPQTHGPRILVCSREELKDLVIEERSLLGLSSTLLPAQTAPRRRHTA
jgi:predicted phage terminase large subunit-like protein